MTSATQPMPTSSSRGPEPTLVPPGQPGANLYNAYHYLTQLSALYAQAAEVDPTVDGKAEWNRLCDQVIVDLGVLVAAWETTLAEARMGHASNVPTVGAQRLVLSARRLARLAGLLNIWVPMDRWTRIALRCETRWQRLLGGFTDASPTVKVKLQPVVQASQGRAAALQGMEGRRMRAKIQVRAAFKQHQQTDPMVANGEFRSMSIGSREGGD